VPLTELLVPIVATTPAIGVQMQGDFSSFRLPAPRGLAIDS
jgi:hypothetical protein